MVTKERPILFSGPMVRAILEGRKSQTRRPVKPQPKDATYLTISDIPEMRCGWGKIELVTSAGFFKCHYGQPGDRLWVRETWAPCDCYDGQWHLHYVADETCISPLDTVSRFHSKALKQYGSKKLRPSIHMPRWASRILLEITSVRLERIQEMPWTDAHKEGYSSPSLSEDPSDKRSAIDFFRLSWNAIYPGSWDRNEFCWVIEFKLLKL